MVDLLNKQDPGFSGFRDKGIEMVPFLKRMLDPTSDTIEVDGKPATARTITVDNAVIPTIVERTDEKGNKRLINLEDVARATNRSLEDVALEEAYVTGNFIPTLSPDRAERLSKVLSREAGLRRERYSLMQQSKGLGDVEMRADLEPYIQDDALARLGYELARRGEVDLASYASPDPNTYYGYGGGQVLGTYFYEGLPPDNPRAELIGEISPVTRSLMATSDKPAAIYENAPLKLSDEFVSKSRLHPAEAEKDTVYERRQAGQEKDTAVHELRHAAIDWLLKNTDLKNNELFNKTNFPTVRTEEYLMDVLSMEAGEKGKEAKLPEFTGTRFTKKIDPEQTQRRAGTDTETRGRPDASIFPEQRQLLNTYANDALKDFNVPDYTERQESIQEEEPEKLNFFQRIFGKKEGGLMMAQEGQALLPMTQATSAPQGGGPKAANPAARQALAQAPKKAPRPGSTDPRDAAVQTLAQDMQKKQLASAPPQPLANAQTQMGGMAAPTNQAVPMMAKGGTKKDAPEGLAVMIGLGAPPSADFERAAEGNPPPGATKSEVADDQLVLLSEGELVVPANVVRYHGLGTYEGMRREALMGLQGMEESGQIEYVSGGAKKADPIDDNGGLIKAQTGTTVLGAPTTTNLDRTIAPNTQAFTVPEAASARFIQNPNQPSTQLKPTTQGTYRFLKRLNAPNVGDYATQQLVRVDKPTEYTQPSTSGEQRGQSSQDFSEETSITPEQRAAEQRYEELVDNRKSAAADLGFTREQGVGSALLGLTPAGFIGGNPPAGTVLLDGTIADGNGNSFDPITGDQVGFKGGILGNIASQLGLMGEPEPVKFAENIKDMNRGLGVSDGARADADLAFERLDDTLPTSQTPAATSRTQETFTGPEFVEQTPAGLGFAPEGTGVPTNRGTVFDFDTTPVGIAAPTVDTVFDFDTTPSGTIGTPQRADEFANLGAPSGPPPIGRDVIQAAIREGFERGVDASRYPAGTTPMNPAEFAGTRSTPMDAAEFSGTGVGATRGRGTPPTGRGPTPMDAGEFARTSTARQTEEAFRPDIQRQSAAERADEIRAEAEGGSPFDDYSDDYNRNYDRARDSGYSRSQADEYAYNKTAADNEAQEQTGSDFATAVTSSDGTPVRSESGNVVTNDYEAAEERSDDGGGCCFIMLEARYGDGTMDEVVRRYRDEHMTVKNKRGYYKLAEVFVPLMRKYPAFKWLVTKTFADPLVSYGKYYYGQNKHGVIFAPVKAFWMKVFDVLGTDTEFVRENGEVI